MICIECTYPIKSLYTTYSPTNIRTTACPNCNKFADKYIEHDAVIIVIDLLLLKPQAYRHMVFNVLSPDNESDSLHPQTKRMWLLITLFDVYLTWAWAEKSSYPTPTNEYVLSLPVLYQYFMFLLYCALDTAVVHLTLRTFAQKWLGWSRPNTLSTAVLLSSSSKLFPILMLIWSYDIPMVATIVDWAVNLNVIEVLTTILACGYVEAITLTGAAVLAKFLVCDFILVKTILWYASI